MDRTALHLEIRNSLSLADELRRHEHARGHDPLAGNLASFESALEQLEREVGRSYQNESTPDPETVAAVERSLEALLIRRELVPRGLARRFAQLFASAERVSLALWEPDVRVPAKPVFGGLPLRRAIPEDVHAVSDYVAAMACLASSRLARTTSGKIVGAALGVSGATLAATTDCRLAVARVVPIETHERLDYVWGATAALAPFVLGYARKDPIAAALHVAAGLGVMAISLFTDYRAERGISKPIRSRGGPRTPRVTEVQRPLEGLASAPSDWAEVR